MAEREFDPRPYIIQEWERDSSTVKDVEIFLNTPQALEEDEAIVEANVTLSLGMLDSFTWALAKRMSLELDDLRSLGERKAFGEEVTRDDPRIKRLRSKLEALEEDLERSEKREAVVPISSAEIIVLKNSMLVAHAADLERDKPQSTQEQIEMDLLFLNDLRGSFMKGELTPKITDILEGNKTEEVDDYEGMTFD